MQSPSQGRDTRGSTPDQTSIKKQTRSSPLHYLPTYLTYITYIPLGITHTAHTDDNLSVCTIREINQSLSPRLGHLSRELYGVMNDRTLHYEMHITFGGRRGRGLRLEALPAWWDSGLLGRPVIDRRWYAPWASQPDSKGEWSMVVVVVVRRSRGEGKLPTCR